MVRTTIETDVAVVGGGAAGFAAAAAAVERNREVTLLEKAEAIGGTTAKSSGAYWIPNNSFMRARGVEDAKADALALMARLSYPSLYDPAAERLGLSPLSYRLLEVFYDEGAGVITRLAETGALVSMQQPLFGDQVGDVDWAIPEYHAELAENKAPYGRSLLPSFDIMSGLGGTEIIRQLSSYFEAQGGKARTGARATSLIVEDGRVAGVIAAVEGGELEVRARRGVVFATGGFTHDREKTVSFLRGPIFGGCAVPSNTGDFIDLAVAAGAALGNLGSAFWSQSALERTLEAGQVAWDEDIFVPFGDSMVIVNKYGRRVGSEKMVYHERTQTHFVFDPQRNEYPNAVQFMIWDRAVAEYEPWHMYRYPVPNPGEQSPHVLEGETLEALGAAIATRIDKLAGRASGSSVIGREMHPAPGFATELQATIERFNTYAQSGIDLEFGRGSTPIQLSWGSVPRSETRANPTMRPFAPSGPYYATLLCGGTLDTCGGPIADEKGRVLRPDGSPIVGLYGAGNCVASVAGQAYWSAGSTLGPALTFGYLAGADCSS